MGTAQSGVPEALVLMRNASRAPWDLRGVLGQGPGEGAAEPGSAQAASVEQPNCGGGGEVNTEVAAAVSRWASAADAAEAME